MRVFLFPTTNLFIVRQTICYRCEYDRSHAESNVATIGISEGKVNVVLQLWKVHK